MRSAFHGFYKPSDEELDKIWTEAIIVLDTSVVLNLYTYSSSTRDELLTLLETFKERVWLPYHVANEYHQGRCAKIVKESKLYSEILKQLRTVKDGLASRKRQPFVDDELNNDFGEVAKKVESSLLEGEKAMLELLRHDPINDRLAELYEGRIGKAPSLKVLEEIYKEGRSRYEKKVPPGYKDSDKPDPEKFGDLVIWKEVIDKAKAESKPVILVTNDGKEDWFHIVDKKTLGPRPELRQEFLESSGQQVYLYDSEHFLRIANERGTKVSEETMEEVEEAKKERSYGLADGVGPLSSQDESLPLFGAWKSYISAREDLSDLERKQLELALIDQWTKDRTERVSYLSETDWKDLENGLAGYKQNWLIEALAKYDESKRRRDDTE